MYLETAFSPGKATAADTFTVCLQDLLEVWVSQHGTIHVHL
jgi:hypothetical protein